MKFTDPMLMPLRAEGGPIHPDDNMPYLHDEQYLNQMMAYGRFHGIDEMKSVACSRPHLLERAVEELTKERGA